MKSLRAFVMTIACASTANAGMQASALLHAYDSGPAKERASIEQLVEAAEGAFREANNVVIVQRNQTGLYCRHEALSAADLIAILRREVGKAPFIGKHSFEIALLHGLQDRFPCQR